MRTIFAAMVAILLACSLAACQSAGDGYVGGARPSAEAFDRLGSFTRDKDVCKAFERPAFSARSDIFASRQSGDCVGR